MSGRPSPSRPFVQGLFWLFRGGRGAVLSQALGSDPLTHAVCGAAELAGTWGPAPHPHCSRAGGSSNSTAPPVLSCCLQNWASLALQCEQGWPHLLPPPPPLSSLHSLLSSPPFISHLSTSCWLSWQHPKVPLLVAMAPTASWGARAQFQAPAAPATAVPCWQTPRVFWGCPGCRHPPQIKEGWQDQGLGGAPATGILCACLGPAAAPWP